MYFKDGQIYSENPDTIASNSTYQTISTSKLSLQQLDFRAILIFILFIAYIYLFATKHYAESGFVFAFLLGMMI